jgi:uncharacterized protein
MTSDIGKKSIDFAFDVVSPDSPIEFSFFGGEPLLCFNLIRQLTDIINAKAGQQKRQVSLNMTTNATRLDDPVLSWIQENRVDLCISIDGPEEIHNANRPYPNGQGSYSKVYNRLRRALDVLPRLQVNAVYGPATTSAMAETFDFFIKENVSVIHFNPDICATWDKAAISGLSKAYHDLAETYIEAYRRGQEVALNLLDSKMVLFLKGGYSPKDICGMGHSELAVAASGNIYPCERFVGEDNDSNYCIGHVLNGFNSQKRCAVLRGRGNHDDTCQKCGFEKYCMNWCGCTNHFMTGKTDKAGAMLCMSERTAIREARRVFITLHAESNEVFLDHLMQYMTNACN